MSVGTSLVVQWLRIHLPMQGRQVRSLDGKLKIPHNSEELSLSATPREAHETMKTQHSQKKSFLKLKKKHWEHCWTDLSGIYKERGCKEWLAFCYLEGSCSSLRLFQPPEFCLSALETPPSTQNVRVNRASKLCQSSSPHLCQVCSAQVPPTQQGSRRETTSDTPFPAHSSVLSECTAASWISTERPDAESSHRPV